MFDLPFSRLDVRVVLSAIFLFISREAPSQDKLGSAAVTLTNAIEFENLSFTQSPLFADQARTMNSVALRPRLVANWPAVAPGASVTATLAPLFRYDPNDTQRTHTDVREAKIDVNVGKTGLTVGYDYVYWGKTESAQIVDIVNQVDMLETMVGRHKLGQPMVALRQIFDVAGKYPVSASAYYLPYFRERTYLGQRSRLRLNVEIDKEEAVFADGASRSTPSYAARLASTAGNVDIALSMFQGLSREPSFRPSAQAGKILPVYGEISQLGFEGQITGDATLWKLEAIRRHHQLNARGDRQDYSAAVAGVEHTIYGFGGRNADLGLIMEYAWDARQATALTPLQNDFVVGARVAMNDANDSAFLVTASVDVKTKETLYRLEYKSRLMDQLFLTVEAGAFSHSPRDSIMYDLRNDNYIRSALTLRW